jgi:hypothetical protein
MNGNRVLFSLTLLAACLALATLSAPARAALVDDAQTVGLWHMETIANSGTEDYVADDNSTGRDAHNLMLDVPCADTHPTLTPGAPGMGNALLFDGVDDAALSPGTWDQLADHVTIEYMVRPDGLPDIAVDNYAGLVGIGPAQTYLQDDGNGMGQIQALVFYNGALPPVYVTNTTAMALGEWHNVSLDVTSDLAITLTVDGETVTGTLPQPMVNGVAGNDFWTTNGAVLGRMWYMAARPFQGALDEVKVSGVVPEPSTLVMVGLAGLAFVLRRKV